MKLDFDIQLFTFNIDDCREWGDGIWFTIWILKINDRYLLKLNRDIMSNHIMFDIFWLRLHRRKTKGGDYDPPFGDQCSIKKNRP